MPTSFESKIQQSLSNPTLQAALDGNAERRLKARGAAFASLPDDLQVFRQRAHALRAETIANLDHYLDEFIENARKNGIVVHRAETAEEAVQIVLAIAKQHDARVISKSKTMVGEEIEINHALEAAGLQAVETDLGEYIIQLRGEPPAHIITPAVHLTRAQVGETFQEKLGVPFTDDIPTLTAIARRVLRQTFLNTDIGMSGVNFGVAETGMLCMVTNEGNGRMVTTLPRVHIALMGIERLVPTLDDLAVVLALLPRSATGQKLTVYTNLMNRPRQPGDLDGPLERHLVLVDNGRSQMRRSPLAEALYCIRCGACLNACPIFREIGGHGYVGATGKGTPYPGPIGSVISAGLFGEPEFGVLARATSLCGACQEACPVDIDLPKLLLRVRSGMVAPADTQKEHAPVKGTHVPWYEDLGLRLFTWAAVSPGRYRFAQRSLGVFGRIVAPSRQWMKMPAASGWGLSRDLARPPARPLRDWMAQQGYSTRQDSHSAPVPAPDHAQAADAELPRQEQIAIADRIARFKDELVALGGQVYVCKDVDDLAEQAAHVLRPLGIDRVMSWDPDQLPDGLLEALHVYGIQPSFDSDPELKAGLTGAPAAAADTGTLVLPSGPGRRQAASLLPEVHLAVLRSEDILPSLADVLQLDWVQQASAVTLVTGPSRTADIEMTLTIGVHGPREVHVFCLE